MGKELEFKFSATEQLLEKLRSQVPGAQTLYQMQTTYYDTPDGALSQGHCTLRCRMENDYPICTFKTPVSETERGEFDVAGVTLPDALAQLAQQSGVQALTQMANALVPVCGAAFTRIAKEIIADGFTAELALDQGVLLGGGKEIPLCEAELEYKSGDEARFLTYARNFAAQYDLQTEKLSKFARAAALAKGA